MSWAAGKGYEAIVKRLLGTGRVDPDLKDIRNGWTPLSWAAKNGHEAVAKLLLANGADPSSKDSNGRTALWYAAEEGHEVVYKLLFDIRNANSEIQALSGVQSREEDVSTAAGGRGTGSA